MTTHRLRLALLTFIHPFRLGPCLLGALLSLRVLAAEPFVIEDIRLEGLQRISPGTVLSYLPVNLGDAFEASRAPSVIRALFQTGFFDDITIGVDGQTLVIALSERPTIASIEITGNKDIRTEQLKDALKGVGLSEGQVLDRSSLERIKVELEQQYFSQGKYGVRVESSLDTLDDNRVDVAITIEEGYVARIHRVNIVGNQAYDEAVLLSKFELGPATMVSLFSDRDQYSRRRLSGDLESLRSHYLDNGYVNFSIDSTQVTITPDKRDVFITVNITEGEQYTVSDIQLAGDLIVPEEALLELLQIEPGQIFSRRLTQQSADAIRDRLGLEGYAFSNVNPVPELDRERREVALTFMVEPGRRIYVRRMNVSGNIRTRDEVVRREFRQMEGGWISTEKVNLSRTRLMRLGFFEEANVETPAVAGVPDMVDVDVAVKERPSGSLMAGVGYSQVQGILLNASISQENVFGTGRRISATVNNSAFNRIYSFSYNNPYYTLDGISRGFSLFARETDAAQANIADFSSDAYGASVDYGFPLSEYNRASLSFGYEYTRIRTNDGTPESFLDFLERNDDRFNVYKMSAGVAHDTRNRAILADAGRMHSLSAELAVPGSDLRYYKLRYRGLEYVPLLAGFTLLVKAEVGHGEAYGSTSGLPFFEHFYAGGPESVRGYRANSLGPSESTLPLGGAFKTVGNIELILPFPSAEEARSLRVSTFFDIGNVFADMRDFESSELRRSAGVSVLWYTPLAPMTFSLGKALNARDGDRTETFQFTLGSFFF